MYIIQCTFVNRSLTLPTIIPQRYYLSYIGIMSVCCSFGFRDKWTRKNIQYNNNGSHKLAVYVVGNLSIFFKGKAANDWSFIIDENSSLD